MAVLCIVPNKITHAFRLTAISQLGELSRSNERPPDDLVQRLSAQNAILKGKLLQLEQMVQQSEEMQADLRGRLAAGLSGVHAIVLFRSLTTWDEGLWVDVGEKNGIQKNSPALFNGQLVGIVDEVTATQSHVRLITHSGLHPSVRVARGAQLLAKGELQGAGQGTLKGVGFAYAYDDTAGPSRDLKSDIIRTGDLLVTTGFDGLFPEGIPVARVTHIDPLREGDCTYTISAEPLVSPSRDMRTLYLLPPS